MAASERISAAGTQDRRFMELALRVARRMLGQTAPNPAVGAVIADEATGEVIARGWTQRAAGRTPRRMRWRAPATRARGKTMYVTLEPCSLSRPHLPASQAMPCAEAILAAGMRRVVCATEDPNPEIAGRGVAVLRQAGVAVDIGLCARGGALDGGRPHPAHDQGPPVRAAQDRRIAATA